MTDVDEIGALRNRLAEARRLLRRAKHVLAGAATLGLASFALILLRGASWGTATLIAVSFGLSFYGRSINRRASLLLAPQS
jgi:hypothetical protein